MAPDRPAFRLRAPTLSLLATFAMVLAAALTVSRGSGAGARKLTLTWYGQSAFTLTSPAGTVALMDPVPDKLGYAMPRLRADLVTVSHEHFDHIALAKADGEPKVIRGLTARGNGWTKVEATVGDVRVRSVGTYHDAKKGRERGRNAVFVFETAGLTVAHLGDLGHLLDASQRDAIGRVDVLLIPVGGTFTIDAAQAARVVEQLRPRLVVIPMHFKTKTLAMDLPLATVEPFLQGKPRVRRLKGNSLDVDPTAPPGGPEVVLLAVAGGG